ARSVPTRLRHTLARLRDRDVLACDVDTLTAFERQLDTSAAIWGVGFAALVVVLLALATLIAIAGQYAAVGILLVPVLAVAGAVAGHHLGRFACYGLRLMTQFHRAGIALRVRPGHIDGCAGLKPVGDFYFYQAMVTALPALFIAVWLFVIPLWP